MPPITKVRHVADYRLELTFADGTSAEVNLRDRIIGKGYVFAPLENVNFFRQVSIDPDHKAITWPNGVDFCADLLYCEITGRPFFTPQQKQPPGQGASET